MLGAGFRLLLLLCRFRLGQILDRDTFSGIGDDIRPARYFGYLHIPDKAIKENVSQRSVFAFALCFKNIFDRFFGLSLLITLSSLYWAAEKISEN